MNLGKSIFSSVRFKEKHSAWIEHTPFAFFLIDKLKPKVFVELGTHFGISYFAFCQAINELKSNCLAYGIDTWLGDEHAGYYDQDVFRYVNQINHSNYSHFSNLLRTTFDAANHLFDDESIDILHIDGLHTYEAVKHDFEFWLPKMSKQGVVIFHDTAVRDGDFGVWRLVDEIRNSYPFFQFEHGYGLGVLCVGKQVEPDFVDFVKAAVNDGFVQNLFYSLGRKVSLEQQNLVLTEHVERLILESDKCKSTIEEKESLIIQLHEVIGIQNQEKIDFQRQHIRCELLASSLRNEIALMNEKIKHIEETNELYYNKNKYLEQQAESIQHENAKLKSQVEVQKLELSKLIDSIFWKVTYPFRKLTTIIKNQRFFNRSNIKLLDRSKLFDKQFYLRANPDIANSGMTPVEHYLKFGGFEGRNPSPFFDSSFYLNYYPDVKVSGINPLVHFLNFGKVEGRITMPAKNSQTYELLRFATPPMNSVINAGIKIIQRIKGYHDLQLLRQSEYFNADYYLRMNPDVQNAGLDPAEHYFYHGWKEGRSAGSKFDSHFYIQSYPDVKASGICPLVHFIKSGIQERRLPKAYVIDEVQCLKNADINVLNADLMPVSNFKIAVTCHLFYMELAEETLKYIRNIPVPFDLYLTTSEENLRSLKEIVLKELPEIKVAIQAVPNRGRDIAPFIMILKNHLFRYDLVCKIHSKKSNHDHNLLHWRKYLLDNLLGSREIICQILYSFESHAELGLVYPLAFPYLTQMGLGKGWGSLLSKDQNLELARNYFPELAPEDLTDDFPFPNGSMFWCRPEALKILMNKQIDINDFPEERRQIDATLAHVIERLMELFCNKAGYVAKTTFFPSNSISPKHLGFFMSDPFRINILFIAHDLCRAGAEIVLLNILRWFARHTVIKSTVLAITRGNDGGKLLSDYQQVAEVFLWEDLLLNDSETEAVKLLSDKIGHIDLIYGNTVISAKLYPYLSIFNAPIITHLHELEESIRKYTSAPMREAFRKQTSRFIACSEPVKDNLTINHSIGDDKIHLIHAFIHPEVDLPLVINEYRAKHDLPANKIIIWGCGTIYWRKGTDLFVETALKLRNKGVRNFIFCWIGGNYWNLEADEWGDWAKYEKIINENNLTDAVLFFGEKDNPKDFLKAGDIFYLPSREDPFPLVCLEAAECELPVICFEGAGGMPDFVEEDAGIVVPFLEVDAAAEAIQFLITHNDRRKELGKNARKKLLRKHSDNIAVPEILNVCRDVIKSAPVVSVIVPVYNHERFLHQRIESILNQTFRDFEIIILDDCSRDKSFEIAQSYLWHPAVSIIQNETNSGSPFRQWQKGIELAKGLIVWIAEGDDMSDSRFLEALLPSFTHEQISLVYCASHRIDENGEMYQDFYLNNGHYENLGFQRNRWLNDYTSVGREEVKSALSIRNTIPNVSAVLFKRSAFQNVDFVQCDQFRVAGDWFVYVSILARGDLSYLKEHLNFHRVHSNSVVARNKLTAENTLPDYYKMHKYIISEFEISDEVLELMINSVKRDLMNLWPDQIGEKGVRLYDYHEIYRLHKGLVQ